MTVGLCSRCFSSGVEVVPTGFSPGFYCLECYELKQTKQKIIAYENRLKKLPKNSASNTEALILKLKGRSDE